MSPAKHQHIIQTSIDTLTDVSGRLLAWLSLIMMVLLCLVVVLRYGFDLGTIALQESVTYLHGSIFMLGAAYTLKLDGHVRVDIFYRNFSPRAKAWINSLGGIIFLLPLCTYIFIISWDYVIQSWAIREVSTEPGGIPAIFLLKTLIPLMAFNLGLQALAEILRSAMVLISKDEASHTDG
ncbi:TRAP transporter small permease subunit [Oceanicoccus sp. KOV_DT_Chl]|uniref:TRAP transporter small permease subunit n=1 Tax=Oceanicoccus sp. KOV_DT_Chl TaxID=1904639 RepID=UPI000C7D2CE6|nr:TRAP transporter small permease subunit [Oceanicoccus sp. KOV_DT_Chl]